MHIQRIEYLKEAAPYLKLYQGKTFVIQIDECLMGEDIDHIVGQLALLHLLDIHFVLLCAGGDKERLNFSSAMDRHHLKFIYFSVLSADISGMIKREYIPVVDIVSSFASLASNLASFIRAEKLIFMTDVVGLTEVLGDDSTLMPQIFLSDLDPFLCQSPNVSLKSKIEPAKSALLGGVPKVHILSGFKKNSLLFEIFTTEGIGTLLVKDG
jgi:acetylglutamate kinase